MHLVELIISGLIIISSIFYFQTPLSHACSNGLLPVVDFLSDIPDVDVNIPDKEGNPPIIFAAQAGSLLISSLIH